MSMLTNFVENLTLSSPKNRLQRDRTPFPHHHGHTYEIQQHGVSPNNLSYV